MRNTTTSNGRAAAAGGRLRKTALAGASSLAVACMMPAGPALAQDLVEELVVTASRVNRSGFDAPTPTTVVGTDNLQAVAATNVADMLNTLPTFGGGTTPSTTSHSSQNAGANFLNLRDLGNNRTLVLVDGRRHVPTTASGLVDINVIPASLLGRVEVVTGGASAAWGSDAVAGVVNLIFREDLEGLEGQVQGSTSQYKDNEEFNLALAGGLRFAGGRGHFMAASEFVDMKGVGADRDWFREHQQVIANPAYRAGNGQPQNLLVPNVTASVATLGGLITDGPLKGLQFLPGGATAPFRYGNNLGTQYHTDGDGLYPGDIISLMTPLTRANLFTRTTYDLTDNVEAFMEASVAYAETTFNLSTSYDLGTLTIRRDNAFLPAHVGALMDANGVSTFRMGRFNRDIAFNVVDNKNATSRIVVGLKGDFGDGWNWDAYYQYGQNRYAARIFNNRIAANFTNALDAVINPATNQIVCRSTLSAPGNGCVPINLFGEGSPSAAAIDYVTGSQHLVANIEQQAAAASLSGEPFSTWAGPVSIATGLEYRKDSVEQRVDAMAQASQFSIGNPKAMKGSYDVQEAFVETVIPLAKDMAFAQSLDFNGAVRATNYSTSGTVWTWKAGFTYEPFDGLKFRATRSRDIRAPNLSELYSSYVLTFSSITDPVTGRQSTVRSPQQDNLALQPEEADTFTAGVVYEPAFAPRLRLSVDYYDIDLQGAISTLTGQSIVNRCAAGAADLCRYITRNPDGSLNEVMRTFINLSSIQVRGVDTEVSYSTPLSDIFEAVGGDLTLRFLGSYLDRYVTNDGMTSLDTAGEVGNNRPHWRWTASASYENGPFKGYVQGRYVGEGLYDVEQTYDDAHVDSQFVTTVSGAWKIKDDGARSLEAFGVISNLFDVDPPVSPNTFIFGSPNSGAAHDIVGRRFTVGLRFTY